MVNYEFLGVDKYTGDNKLPHHYFLIQKENQEHYFVIEEHYEEFHSLLISV